MDRLSISGLFAPRVALSFALCFAGVLLAMMAWSSAAGTKPAEIAAKIAPEVFAETADGGSASVVILLADQADVSAAHQMKDPDARGWFVYNTLTQHASRTQAGLRAELEARGATYQSFWAANMIVATADRALIESLAAREDVAMIDSNNAARWIEPPDLADFSVAPNTPSVPNSPEWGVQNVNAPAVWAMGFTGQGIVIGDQDTGERWTHNALKPKYRGWNGTTADHNFNWHDAIHSATNNPCGVDTVVPCDDSGHGTHTAGTTVGDDGAGNQIGVAPGAKWIGCRNMDQGNGTPARYTECFQFMMAPTDLNGNNADPTLRAHVLNNSWGCPSSEGCTTRAELETIINNTEASGIFVVVSAGNSGSGCSSVSDVPAIYNASFSVGAYDINNTLAGFSSRGPSTYYNPALLKPNISAPGVTVRSTYYSSDTTYANLSGTSMAGPHVAGAVALLWSARSQLLRDIAATKTLLQNTANRSVTVTPPQLCGGTLSSTDIPNNSFGYGRVDVLAAVNASSSPSPTPTATATATPTATATATPTATATATPTATAAATATASATPTATPTSTPTATPTATPPTVLGNISSRLRVEIGDNVLIGGFIITGTQDKKVIVRALGPSLSLADKLADPTLELRDSSGGLVQINDNWSTSPNRQAIIDSGLAPSNDLESAIIATLPANGKTYTAIVRGVGGTTGTGVVEVYDIDRSVGSKLANISTRGLIQTADTILIAGTIVVGQTSQKVIVRAIGPSLNIANKLADPKLELRDANGAIIRANDNWRTGGQETEIMQSGVAPTNDLESVLIETLPANNAAYTAIVRGVNDATGIAVVEVYALN
jgi:subtilisin family serine protease